MATKKDGRTADERRWPSIKKLTKYGTWQVDSRIGGGGDRGGKREVFATEEAAKARRNQLRVERDQKGVEAIEVETPLRVEAVQCSQRLAAVGKTLTDATNFFLEDLARRMKSVPWTQFYDEYAKLVNGTKLSPSHIADTVTRVGYFRDYAGGRLVREITADEFTNWLDSLRVTKLGQALVLLDVSACEGGEHNGVGGGDGAPGRVARVQHLRAGGRGDPGDSEAMVGDHTVGLPSFFQAS
ncbi:MAG: hypothetical protein WCI40_00600 [Verrucomicrobiota bacterium]